MEDKPANNKAKQKDTWWRRVWHYITLRWHDFFAPYFKKIKRYLKFDAGYFAHQRKIKQLQKQHAKVEKLPSTWGRVLFLLLMSLVVWWLFSKFGHHLETATKEGAESSRTLFNFWQLLITAPILFIVWMFRDQNRLNELHNKRKDTSLKEFQKLQEWATGNVPNKNNDGKANPEGIALQISALHALRPYLKGEFGEDFRRGTFEIYASTLQTQHQKTQQTLRAEQQPLTFGKIKIAISKCELTKQINRIASEDWFNLLINHDFPTKTISLIGVDLRGRYLHHKTYGTPLDLSEANLQGSDLGGAQLQGANLDDAQLQGASLFGAHLQGANLGGSQLQGVSLFGAHLQGADLDRAQLQGADLGGAQLQGANLGDAQLQGANLGDAQLQGANLGDAQLQGANLDGAQLQGADLSIAQLQGANLGEAQLQGANLYHAQLQGVVTKGPFFESGVFEENTYQQIGEEASLEGISENMLDESEVATLKQTLDLYLDEGHVTVIINRIKNAKEPITLIIEGKNKTQLGSYSKEDADRWIAEYNEAMGLPINNEEES